MFRKLIAAVVAVGAATLGVAAATTVAASATTNTCLNISIPLAPPVGCGGLVLGGPLGSLALTAQGSFYNAKVVLEPASQVNTMQDWTVYQVAGTTPTSGGIDGMGDYIAELTPAGDHTGRCLSVERVRIRHHHHRWQAVLRPCGGVITPAFAPGGTGGHGVPGVVTAPNPFQVWSPLAGAGLELANEHLSGNFINATYVLTDTKNGGAGTWQSVTVDNGDPDQQWGVVGCTNPVRQLSPAYWNCP